MGTWSGEKLPRGKVCSVGLQLVLAALAVSMLRISWFKFGLILRNFTEPCQEETVLARSGPETLLDDDDLRRRFPESNSISVPIELGPCPRSLQVVGQTGNASSY